MTLRTLGRVAPGAGLAVWLVVVLLATGVPAGDVLAYAAYQLGLIVLPGVGLYRVLCRPPGGAIRQLAFGYTLGLALEVLVFVATAAGGVRWALPWGLACVGVLSWVAGRGNGRSSEPSLPLAASWAIAAVCAIALAYLAVDSFTQEPLPGSEASLVYHPDLVWYVSVAAEARQHWPPLDPNVAGESLNYHVFAMYEWAASAEITGVDLATVAFRLSPATMLVALGLLLAAGATSRGGHRRAGPLAALLVLLAWPPDLDLGARDQYVGLVTLSFLSPTFLLGLIFFLPAMVLMSELLDERGEGRSAGRWWLLAVLLGAGAGAKASILPVVLTGLVVFAVWSLRVRGRIGSSTYLALAITAVILAISSLLIYAGRPSGFRFEPFSVLSYAVPPSPLGVDSGDIAYLAAALPLSLLLLLPLAGCLWVLRDGLGGLSTRHALLLSMLVPALGAYYMLGHDGGSQTYFLVYGYVAAALVSADGLLEAASAWVRGHRRLPAGVLLAGGLMAALACGVAGAEALGAAGVELGLRGRISLAGALAVVVALVVLAAQSASTQVAARALTALALGATAAVTLDAPLDRLPRVAQLWLSESSTAHRTEGGSGGQGMSRELYAGLAWVRRNTKSSALLAVNNYYLDPVSQDARYVYYSAFAERRVFLEGWGYSARTFDVGFADVKAGQPAFPRRLALNNAAIKGNSRALRTLAARGVTHVLVDKAHGPAPREPPGSLIFSNRALALYELRHTQSAEAVMNDNGSEVTGSDRQWRSSTGEVLMDESNSH